MFPIPRFSGVAEDIEPKGVGVIFILIHPLKGLDADLSTDVSEFNRPCPFVNLRGFVGDFGTQFELTVVTTAVRSSICLPSSCSSNENHKSMFGSIAAWAEKTVMTRNVVMKLAQISVLISIPPFQNLAIYFN